MGGLVVTMEAGDQLLCQHCQQEILGVLDMVPDDLLTVSIGVQTGMPALMFLFLVLIVEPTCIVETWGAFAGANR